MDRKFVLSFLVLGVVLSAFQVAEPISAATQIDSGKWISSSNGHKITTYYKAYRIDNVIYTKATSYMSGKAIISMKIYMKKISSSTLKYYDKSWSTSAGTHIQSDTEVYGSSATSYYWNKLKPQMTYYFTH